MAPKDGPNLRNPSTLGELAQGSFQPVIAEVESLDPAEVERIIVCSGKVYFDLLEARRARGLHNAAIVRIEQLYPFPKEECASLFDPYPNARELVWCQEEPQNQGAWDLIKHRFHRQIDAGKKVYYVGRPTSAAPAVGNRAVHIGQQEKLIDDALSGHIDPSMNRRIPR